MVQAAYLIEKKTGQTGFEKFKGTSDAAEAFSLKDDWQKTFPGSKVKVYAVPADQLDGILRAAQSTNGRTNALQESGVEVSSLKELSKAKEDLDRITNINSVGSFDHLWNNIPSIGFAPA